MHHEPINGIVAELEREIRILRAENDALGWQVHALRARADKAGEALAIVRAAVRAFDVVPGDERAEP
jgi:hypothetical protein